MIAIIILTRLLPELCRILAHFDADWSKNYKNVFSIESSIYSYFLLGNVILTHLALSDIQVWMES